MREQGKEDWDHLVGRGGFMTGTHGPRKDVTHRTTRSKAQNESAKAVI